MPEDQVVITEEFEKMIPGGASEEFKQQMKAISEAKKAAAGAAPGAAPDPKKEGAAPAAPKNEGAGDESIKIKIRKTVDNPNPLLSAIETEEEEVELKTISDVMNLFKQNGISDISEALALVPLAKNTSAELEKTKREAAELRTLIETLPEPVFAQANAFWNQRDYREILNQLTEMDYTVPVDQVKPAALISKYFADSITPEASDETHPTFKAFYEASKVKYLADQEKFNKSVKDAISIQETQRKKKEASLSAAKARIKSDPILKSLPDTVVDEAAQELMSNMFNDRFFMPDGSFTDTAIENYLILKNGKDLLSSVQKKAETKGASAEAEALAKATEEKRKKESAGAGSGMSDGVKEILAQINRTKSTSQFEHVDKPKQ